MLLLTFLMAALVDGLGTRRRRRSTPPVPGDDAIVGAESLEDADDDLTAHGDTPDTDDLTNGDASADDSSEDETGAVSAHEKEVEPGPTAEVGDDDEADLDPLDALTQGGDEFEFVEGPSGRPRGTHSRRLR